MAVASKSAKPPIVRLTGTFVAAPGVLGYSHLTEPDEAFDTRKFDANIHYTDEQLKHLADRVTNVVIEPLWERFLKECDDKNHKAPKAGLLAPRAEDWIEEHLKEPSERAASQLPYLGWKTPADFRKDGVMVQRTLRATDAAGSSVDLKAAKVGPGSVVQALLSPCIWASALSKGQAALSFRLSGLRILHLVQYSGGGQHLDSVSDEDLALVEAGFQAEDLSAFAKPKESAPVKARESDTINLDDDDIPF